MWEVKSTLKHGFSFCAILEDETAAREFAAELEEWGKVATITKLSEEQEQVGTTEATTEAIGLSA